MRKILLLLLLCTQLASLPGQCPVITETKVSPNCIPSCEMCDGGKFTITLTGGDLPHNGKIEYYADENPGYNPYTGQGTKIGEANISTPNPNCRICPQMLGFMIDACGSEAVNEFVIIWTGSGFNTSNLNFDFDVNNNFMGGGNNDIGAGGCGVVAGNAGLIGGCSATSVGAGYNLPANAILILFTSTGANTNYDFSAICGLGLKVFVISNSCTRNIGAFSNSTSTGMRTQVFSVASCACSTVITYDTDDPGLMGDGDNYSGGIGNNGCAAPDVNVPNYTPAPSTVAPFTFTIPQSWCDKTFEIVGIINPRPDPMCCGDVFTERFEVRVKCPKATSTSLEVCETGTGVAVFDLSETEDAILNGANGIIEWYRDAAGTMRVISPFTSPGTTLYARIVDGTCKSALVPIILTVLPLPLARKANAEECDEGGGFATFDLSKLIKIITGNNPSNTVQFYGDILLTDPISSPLNSNTTKIYATTFNGKCESKPVEITLTVLPLPQAKSISITGCDEGDGKASFDLIALGIQIKGDTQSSKTVLYYEDPSLTKPIFSPYRTANDTLYAVVNDGICSSFPVEIKLSATQFFVSNNFTDKKCDDGSGFVFFDLQESAKIITAQDSTLKIIWYIDSLLKDTASSPYQVFEKDTLYAIMYKGLCKSNRIEILLEKTKRPLAQSAIIQQCTEDSTGKITFYLPLVKDTINLGSGLDVIYSEDSLFNTVIGPEYTSGSRIIYAKVKDGSCFSPVVPIQLQAIPGIDIFPFPPSNVCEYLVLPKISGYNLSGNEAYYTEPDGQGIKFVPGDTLYSVVRLYAFDFNVLCKDEQNFDFILNFPPRSGRDNIVSVCDGSNVDLTQLLINADPNGNFIDFDLSGLLSGNIFRSGGQNGKTFRFQYITEGFSPCTNDTSLITISVVKTVNAGQDANIGICDGDILTIFPSLVGADAGGTFSDPNNTGALNSGIWDSNISGTGSFPIMYVVGDGIICAKDQSSITILVNERIEINLPSSIHSCDSILLPVITGKNVVGRTGYYSGSNGTGIAYKAGDVFKNSGLLYIYGEDVNFCSDQDTLQLLISTVSQSDYKLTNLCPEYSEIIGGITFNKNNPNGRVTLSKGSANQCDSIITVSMTFLPENIFTYQPSICDFDSVLINNTLYHKNKRTGREVLKNGSSNGCDSIIDINLTILPTARSTYNRTLCENVVISINGNRFDKNNPRGDVFFPGTGTGACDSIVSVNLTFYPPATGSFQQSYCEAERIPLHGKTYTATNATGIDTLLNGSVNGCDSIVFVNLTFNPNSTGNYQNSICRGDSIQLHGKTYDENKLTGTDTLKAAGSNGCDSIVDVQLSLKPVPSFTYRNTICVEESIVLGNMIFDTLNYILLDTLYNASSNGCDSIVDIQLFFHPNSSSQFQQTLCEDQFILINGTRYDKNKTNGIEILSNSSSTGCDSTLFVSINFQPAVRSQYSEIICANRTTSINGKLYDALTQFGIDTFIGAAVGGCDSIVDVSIQIKPISTHTIQQTLCEGEFQIIHGKKYDINNPKGQEIISSGSSNGCDSIIQIDLHFTDLDVNYNQEYTISLGQSISLNINSNFTPDSIAWSPALGLSCTDCLQPTANPEQTTTYTLQLFDNNGCEIIISIKVNVITDDRVYFPNSFSPNNDQINDYFKIISSNPNVEILQFMVFDRWGELLYNEMNTIPSSHQGWDGTFKKKDMIPGVYIYYLKVKIGNTVKELKGDITLIR